MNKYRTHNCSELGEKEIGKKINLSGFVDPQREVY